MLVPVFQAKIVFTSRELKSFFFRLILLSFYKHKTDRETKFSNLQIKIPEAIATLLKSYFGMGVLQ